jgi:hypothetical protein
MKDMKDMKDTMNQVVAAYDSNDREQVKKAFKRLQCDSIKLDTMFRLLAAKHPKYGADYFENETLMPAVYSADVRHLELMEETAKKLRLGEKSVLNFSGSKSKGHSATLALENLIDIFNITRSSRTSELQNSLTFFTDERKRVLEGIISLPELDQNSSSLWVSEMVEYLTLWANASKEAQLKNPSVALTLWSLVDASSSYANSRLTSKKKTRLKALKNKYPDGEPFQGLNVNDLSFDCAKELTTYRLKIDEIDKMQLDNDCYRYGVKRLLTEKMKMLRI